MDAPNQGVRSMASWPGARHSLRGDSRSAGRLYRAEPNCLRLHLAGSSATKHLTVATGFSASPVGQMVSQIGGGRLDNGLASPLTNNAAAEPGNWSNPDISRAASDELFCGRAVDGVSAVRSDRASDDDKLWDDGRIPTA
jgi:hypothetical protein